MDDREARDRDIDDALRRVDELIADHPQLTPDTILSALDDEFVGSTIFPSQMGEIRREVDRRWTAKQVLA